jgi:hypothetical protein
MSKEFSLQPKEAQATEFDRTLRAPEILVSPMEIIPDTEFNGIGQELRKVIRTSETPEAVKESWTNGFSDPRTHTDSSFRYLVHGFQGRGGDIIQTMHMLQALKTGEAEDLGEKIDLLTHPHKVGEKKLISSSVIDQDHRTTFGDAGLILRALAENVLDAFPTDAGTDFANPTKEINTSTKNKCSVNELMYASNDDSWNEVRLVGTTEAGKVEAAGVWIKVTEEGKAIDEETARQLRATAAREDLPVINIDKKIHIWFQLTAMVLGIIWILDPTTLQWLMTED